MSAKCQVQFVAEQEIMNFYRHKNSHPKILLATIKKGCRLNIKRFLAKKDDKTKYGTVFEAASFFNTAAFFDNTGLYETITDDVLISDINFLYRVNVVSDNSNFFPPSWNLDIYIPKKGCFQKNPCLENMIAVKNISVPALFLEENMQRIIKKISDSAKNQSPVTFKTLSKTQEMLVFAKTAVAVKAE